MIDQRIQIDTNKCIGCLQCVHNCPNQALSYEGEYKSIEEIVSTCLQDKDFYEESNGGVTISGGEGMSQPIFLKELIKALKKHNIQVILKKKSFRR